jgi:hypothetical protein
VNSRLRLRASIVAALATTAIVSVCAGSAMAAPPANDNFADRQDLNNFLPTSVTGTTVEATAETGEPDHTTAGEGPDSSIWYQWIAPASQAIKFDACSGEAPVLGVYTGLSVGALTPVGGTGGCSAVVNVTENITYKIALDGVIGEGPTNLEIRALTPPANDAFEAQVSLGSGASFSVDGTTVDATREAGEADDPWESAGSVWYSWTPAGSGPATLSTCDSEGDPTLTVYTGNAVDALDVVASDDDAEDPDCAPNGLGSRVSFNAVAGTAYRIAVASLCSDCEGAFTLVGSQTVATPPVQNPPTTQPKPKPKKCKKGFKRVKKNGKVKCKKIKKAKRK